MSRFGSLLRTGLALAALAPSFIVAAPPARANDTGALIGGLIAGAVVGSAVAAATRPRPHYYYGYGAPPPPAYYPPPPRPVYGPGYCGAPPYPPCRMPVY